MDFMRYYFKVIFSRDYYEGLFDKLLYISALTKQGGVCPMFTGFSDFFSKIDISEAPEGFWEP